MERLKLDRSHRYKYILYASIPSPSQALGDCFRAALENTPDLSGGETYVIMRGRKGGHVAKGSFNLLGQRAILEYLLTYHKLLTQSVIELSYSYVLNPIGLLARRFLIKAGSVGLAFVLSQRTHSHAANPHQFCQFYYF